MIETFELSFQGRRRRNGDGCAPKTLRLILEAAIEKPVVKGPDRGDRQPDPPGSVEAGGDTYPMRQMRI